MNKSILAAAAVTSLLALVGSVRGDVIYTEDFDGAGTLGYTTEDLDGNPLAQFSDGVTDYFIVTDGSDIHPSLTFNNVSGRFLAAQDVDGEGGPGVVRFRISGIDISNYENLRLSIDFAEADSYIGGYSWDNIDPYTDWVHANLSIDDSGDDHPDLNGIWWVGGNAGAEQGMATRDLDFDGLPDGPDVLTNHFTTFSQDFSQTGETAGILITIKLNGGDEDVVIDNITLHGDVVVPEPGAVATLGLAGLALLRRRRP